MERLETPRLILRDWAPEDAGDLYAYACSPVVGPMAGWKPHDNLAESRNILEMFRRDGDTWALEEKATGRVIGSVGLHRHRRPDLPADLELGYVLGEAWWGRGLMPEAAGRAVEYAFAIMQADALSVAHFPDNRQSRRVIEKLGFHFVRADTQSWQRWDGKRLDERIYLLTREEHLAAKAESTGAQSAGPQ